MVCSSTRSNHLTGGASGTAKADGTGQGEGAFKDVPSAKVRPIKCVRQLIHQKMNKKMQTKMPITASQGIYSDNLRGQTTASPHRDANYETTQHSKVYGLEYNPWKLYFYGRWFSRR